jgi:CRISPR/Cas system-associated exonuclease Cas4 (RecB family)
MPFSLIESTDSHMTRHKFSLPRESHFYPSSSSVAFIDKNGIPRVEGSCLRQVYYQMTGTPGAIKPDAYSEWIFATGKGVEEILVEQWKQMGIWVANNIKFFDKERNISGELDVVLSEPDGTPFIVEVKSFAGYQATKEIIGNKHQPGHPKTSQLLQTLIYLDLGKRLNLVQYAKMIYYARDSGERREFNITLTEDGELHRPTIDGEIDWRFTVEDIYLRFLQLQDYLDKKELPPRDYESIWDPQKVELERSLGSVSQSKYDAWKKSPSKNPIGCWQCRYCNFSQICNKELNG